MVFLKCLLLLYSERVVFWLSGWTPTFLLARSSSAYLLFGQDGGHSFGPSGVQGVTETIHFFVKHLAVEEQ